MMPGRETHRPAASRSLASWLGAVLCATSLLATTIADSAANVAGAPDGVWSEPAAAGGPTGYTAWFSLYDPVGRRMLLDAYDTTPAPNDRLFELTLGGSPVWREITPQGTRPAPRRSAAAIYDPVSARVIMFGGLGDSLYDDVWQLDLSGTPTWSPLLVQGTPPAPRYGASAVFDAEQRRMVVYGGADAAGQPLGDVWFLSLDDPPQWLPVAPGGTPPPARFFAMAAYDAEGERMLLFGGTQDNDGALNDLWSLGLAADPEWALVPVTGPIPPPRSQAGAFFDPLRERMIVVGGLFHGAAQYDVWSFDAVSPAWRALAPTGDRPHIVFPSVIYDPEHDRAAMVDPTFPDGAFLTFGEPLAPAFVCATESKWSPGDPFSLGFTLTNPYPQAQWIDYRIESRRNWPGFPLVGQFFLESLASRSVSELALIPDTAAAGFDSITVLAVLRAIPQAVACTTRIHDVTTATLVSLAEIEAEPRTVRIAWSVSGDAEVARIERREEGAGWRSVVDRPLVDHDRMAYEDRDVDPGRRYGYRVVLAERGASWFAGEAWIDVPASIRLGITARANPSARPAVMVSLLGIDPAVVEAVDVAGRVRSRVDLIGRGAGTHLVSLAPAALESGVYWLRLTQSAKVATTRIVVIR
jgi:hypothetical protein